MSNITFSAKLRTTKREWRYLGRLANDETVMPNSDKQLLIRTVSQGLFFVWLTASICITPTVQGLVQPLPDSSRRALLVSTVTAPFVVMANSANARFIMDNDTGEYIEIEQESDWQTTWKQRLEKAQSMSQDDVFLAARGAGNVQEQESDASKKRRAMAGCREAKWRDQTNTPDAKECTARVLKGDVSFMLDVM